MATKLFGDDIPICRLPWQSLRPSSIQGLIPRYVMLKYDPELS